MQHKLLALIVLILVGCSGDDDGGGWDYEDSACRPCGQCSIEYDRYDGTCYQQWNHCGHAGLVDGYCMCLDGEEPQYCRGNMGCVCPGGQACCGMDDYR